MNIRILFSLLLAWFLAAHPTQAAAQPAGLPPFKMLLTNGRFFSASDLPKGKPVVLIYFAPDCDHCQQFLSPFFKKINAFKSTEVVLVTFKPVSELPLFERSYQTASYPNLHIGTEGNTNYLRNFYKLQTTPFVALYDRDAKLVHSYRKEPPVDDLIQRLNRLNN